MRKYQIPNVIIDMIVNGYCPCVAPPTLRLVTLFDFTCDPECNSDCQDVNKFWAKHMQPMWTTRWQEWERLYFCGHNLPIIDSVTIHFRDTNHKFAAFYFGKARLIYQPMGRQTVALQITKESCDGLLEKGERAFCDYYPIHCNQCQESLIQFVSDKLGQPILFEQIEVIGRHCWKLSSKIDDSSITTSFNPSLSHA
jgi:hypothetical protein